ncbi:MAG: hypothetical protein EOO20_05150 [Chryseobacterium sp.]|nr:MAG: hypothetical protein EOO20_05150 [Chryseobacterium sp.]
MANIDDALTVTLGYLVKDAEYEQIDSDALKLLKEVQGLERGEPIAHVRHNRRFHKSSKAKEHSTVQNRKARL